MGGFEATKDAKMVAKNTNRGTPLRSLRLKLRVDDVAHPVAKDAKQNLLRIFAIIERQG